MMLSKERGQYFQEQYDKLQYRFANNELNKKCEQLEKENQQLKKQKDDVVEYIKKQSKFIQGCDIYQPLDKDIILRMLGEIDE